MAESDNILTRLQDLLVYLIPQLNKFPRPEQKPTGRSLCPVSSSRRTNTQESSAIRSSPTGVFPNPLD
jgi:hypothetical protein